MTYMCHYLFIVASIGTLLINANARKTQLIILLLFPRTTWQFLPITICPLVPASKYTNNVVLKYPVSGHGKWDTSGVKAELFSLLI